MSPASTTWKRAVPTVLGFLVFVAVLGRTLWRAPPVHNWDMLGYMALSLEWGVGDPVEVHRRTYEAARAELPPEVFQDLVASGVRRERFEDPAAFHEHLPFYRARVLYTGLVALVHAAGVPLVQATHGVSLGAFALLAILMFLWVSRSLPPRAAVPVALALAHAPPLVNTACWATADALATGAILFGTYFALERRSWLAAWTFLVLSILARPDSIVLAVLWGAALCAVPRPDRPSVKALALGLAACFLSYLGVQAHAGEYGWWPVFQISFLEKSIHPSELPTAVDLAVYRDVIARQLAALPGEGYFMTEENVTGSTLVFPYASLAFVGLVLSLVHRARAARPGAIAGRAALLAALLLMLPLRWFLFPQLWDRMLAVFYASVPLVLLSIVSLALEARAPRTETQH